MCARRVRTCCCRLAASDLLRGGTTKRSARAYATSLGAKLSESEGPSCEGPTVPGTGFEPVFLGSEASVLPARRSRSRRTAWRARARARRRGRVVRRGGRSGGDRTLTFPGKSRVRFQLRYGPAWRPLHRPCSGPIERVGRAEERTSGGRRAVRAGRGRVDLDRAARWDARESNPHPSA